MAKLLLVDDDEDLAETLQDLFEIHGYQCELAEDGRAALDLLNEEIFDLVMLDWQLPDMDGLEVCKRYRAGGGGVQILMLSGMRDPSAKEEAMSVGANSFLTKPFTVDQLVKRVQLMLNGALAE